jgi:hypothetical protein
MGHHNGTPQRQVRATVLPAFLDEVILRGLSVRGASVDVARRRAGTEIAANVRARNGNIGVMITS